MKLGGIFIPKDCINDRRSYRRMLEINVGDLSVTNVGNVSESKPLNTRELLLFVIKFIRPFLLINVGDFRER